ncbi:Protein-glutamate methylesterase family protein [Candidatus Rhodobacter oscarellae]|uniref:Protein-glutamate methylesterase family protein n=1 Tax=Candidatus Rhodobacter oscarellae TaxID=1675527 RepID=A0A0J9GZ90_9RHOB|nr:LptA/OstA family protein [Candidatus Rhodobacter lobularis]KMW58788.1 Protein-glutamate methylesterase family protein [Candidatus Rhodobacter lobularis]
MTFSKSLPAIVLGLFLSGALGAAGAMAQTTAVSMGLQNHNSDSPMEITSEELSIDQEESVAVFEGNVLVRQGELTMTCARMVVEYGPDENGKDEIKIVRMFGGVTLASPEETAESDRAVYTLAVEKIVMLGDVLVTQGATAISSNQLTYDLDTGDGLLEGDVKTVLQ